MTFGRENVFQDGERVMMSGIRYNGSMPKQRTALGYIDPTIRQWRHMQYSDSDAVPVRWDDGDEHVYWSRHIASACPRRERR